MHTCLYRYNNAYCYPQHSAYYGRSKSSQVSCILNSCLEM